MPALRQTASRWECLRTGEYPKGIDRHVANGIASHVKSSDFPCPMAQTTAASGNLIVGVYQSMADDCSLDRLLSDLQIWRDMRSSTGYHSFVAMFHDDRVESQQAFHTLMWSALRSLRNRDETPPSPTLGTSDDIQSSDFALSLNSEPYFVVGLSPQSPRLSRRTAFCGIAFNPHEQFERLRSTGQMPRIEKMSRKRDIRLQGDSNPLLNKHGDASAARQYSACPLSRLPNWP